jgi:hypothetical protein
VSQVSKNKHQKQIWALNARKPRIEDGSPVHPHHVVGDLAVILHIRLIQQHKQQVKPENTNDALYLSILSYNLRWVTIDKPTQLCFVKKSVSF